MAASARLRRGSSPRRFNIFQVNSDGTACVCNITKCNCAQDQTCELNDAGTDCECKGGSTDNAAAASLLAAFAVFLA